MLNASILLLSLLASGSGASAEPNALPAMLLSRVEEPPRIEDFLEADPSTPGVPVVDFRQREPEDGTPVSEKTTAYLSYDDRNLYVVFRCQDQPGGVRAHMVKREQAMASDDWVGILLDTFQDRRRAYAFYVNPLGVQADSVLVEGQEEDFTFDTVWHSKGQLSEDGYLVWIAIPFKSLRFSGAALQKWGVALGRAILRKNEVSWWPHLSRKVDGLVQQFATLEGLEGIASGKNIQAIPYLLASRSRFLGSQPNPTSPFQQQSEVRAGVDAKFVFKNALTIDVALQPDFSQVESDEPQVTVNQRFEVFFPEKRPFFLENADFFNTPINLLFTRRIADPQIGVRATGKLGPYSVGALFADDRSFADSGGTDAGRASFNVLRVSRDILGQSTLGGLYAERSLDGSDNRVAGLDGRLKIDDHWSASFQVAASTTLDRDSSRSNGTAIDFHLGRISRNFTYKLDYEDRSPGFRADTGFVPRVDMRNLFHYFKYRFRPETGKLIAWGPDIVVQRIWDHQGRLLEAAAGPALHWEFPRQTAFGIYFIRTKENLRPQDFPALVSEQAFHYTRRGMPFSTSPLPQLSLSGSLETGGGLNFVPLPGSPPEQARLTEASAGLTIRPTTAFTIDNTYLLTRLADFETGRTTLNSSILRSRWNYQISRELSLRFILQYEAVLPDVNRIGLERTKRVTGDFLLTYLLNPGTALHLGYSDLRENLILGTIPYGRSDDPSLSVGRHLFVKISYLFRP